MQSVRRGSHQPPHCGAAPVALALAAALGACGPAQRSEPPGGTESTARAETTAAPAPRRMPMAGMPAMGGRGGMMGRPAPPAPGSTTTLAAPLACATPDAAAAARGRAVYAAAPCTSCHGADAHGTRLAPNLADDAWIDADGSYQSIAAVIRAGVPHPRQFATPMPPAGGARLGTRQLCDLAAYVYSLSR